MDKDPQGQEPTDREDMRTAKSKGRDGCIWWATDSWDETISLLRGKGRVASLGKVDRMTEMETLHEARFFLHSIAACQGPDIRQILLF